MTFPYPSIDLNLFNPEPSIYLKTEKGTRSERSLNIPAITRRFPTKSAFTFREVLMMTDINSDHPSRGR